MKLFRTFVQVKRAISIFFTSIILLSSTGFTLTTHYCMGHAVESAITLGEDDLTCGMTDMEAACEVGEEEVALIPQTCCDNDHLSLQIEDDYQLDSETISIEKQFIFVFTYTFLSTFSTNLVHTFTFSNSHSPPLDTDIQSMYQTFLL